MKKIKIIFFIIIWIFFLIILNPKSYCANSINLRDYIDKILISGSEVGLSGKYLNEEYFHDYETGGDHGYGKYDFSYNNTDTADYDLSVNYYWLHAVDDLIKKINSKNYSYDSIAESNSASDIDETIDALEKARDVIGTFSWTGKNVTPNVDGNLWTSNGTAGDYNEYSVRRTLLQRQGIAQRSVVAFRNITGYNAASGTAGDKERNDYDNYIGRAIRELNAARDVASNSSTYKTDTGLSVNINDDYITKFKYNTNQIGHYVLKVYGMRINVERDSGDIQNLWYAKMGLRSKIDKGEDGFSQYQKILDDTNIYVQKDDSYSTKMSYTREQVWVYLQLWMNNNVIDFNGLNNAEQGTLLREWQSLINSGAHTDFYKRNYNGSKFSGVTDSKITASEIGNAYGDLRKVENLIQEGKDYISEHQNDFNEKYSNDELDSKETEKVYDKDEDTVFLQPVGSGAASNGVKDALSDADSFVQSGDKGVVSTENLQSFSQNLYSILLAIGVVIAVIMGTILGVKLMVAPIEERVEAKKLLVPYVVGCVIVFGAFGIWKLVVTIMQGL